MKAILKKLYGNNKRSTGVKQALTKFNLNIQSLLETQLNDQEKGLNDMESAIDEIGVFVQKLKDGQSFQYDASNIFYEEFEKVKEKLNEIGLDLPPEFEQLEQRKMNLDELYYKYVDRFNNIDMNFNSFN